MIMLSRQAIRCDRRASGRLSTVYADVAQPRDKHDGASDPGVVGRDGVRRVLRDGGRASLWSPPRDRADIKTSEFIIELVYIARERPLMARLTLGDCTVAGYLWP